MKRLRIGVSCFSTFGGSGVVATALGQAMAARGHEVVFVGDAPPQRLDLTQPRLRFHPVPTGFDPPPGDAFALAAALLEVRGLDLIHAHYALPHAAAAVLARQLGSTAPVITTLHGTDVTTLGADPRWQPLLRMCLAQSAAVTVPSHALARAAAPLLAGPAEVIPDFVDTEVFRPLHPDDPHSLSGIPGERRREIGRAADAADELRLVHVSNFRPVKRVQAVVDVFRRVLAQQPARLLLIGDGPDRPAVEHAAADLGDRVRFIGKRHHFEAVLRAATVFLLPSATESFGLAALEALASGVPVVASNVGGLPEVVRHGETGWLVAPHDHDAMAAHVLTLTDPTRRQAMGEAARADAVARFAQGPIVDRYEALYQRVVAG
jgi:N-acetyl-alpha-D-glucosaminyl L-malate synthase BshA